MGLIVAIFTYYINYVLLSVCCYIDVKRQVKVVSVHKFSIFSLDKVLRLLVAAGGGGGV